MLIDTHCHLTDLNEEEVRETINRAQSKGVSKFICIGASRGKESNLTAHKYSLINDNLFISIGIHPHDVDTTQWDQELLNLANQSKVVAIGETGLDYFKNWSDFKLQKECFIKSINIAKDLQKPLIIHCRDALEDTLKILESENASKVGGVFHCYSGSFETARRLRDINFYVSYTGILTFKNSHSVRKGALEIPLKQILLETDSPYMAPEPFRGKPSEPAHVYEIAKCLAEIKGVTFEEVSETTTQNAKNLFRLP